MIDYDKIYFDFGLFLPHVGSDKNIFGELIFSGNTNIHQTQNNYEKIIFVRSNYLRYVFVYFGKLFR